MFPLRAQILVESEKYCIYVGIILLNIQEGDIEIMIWTFVPFARDEASLNYLNSANVINH